MDTDRIEDADLWKTRALEQELEVAKAKAEIVIAKFQAHLDSMWVKYGLAKDKDKVLPDGTIQRGE